MKKIIIILVALVLLLSCNKKVDKEIKANKDPFQDVSMSSAYEKGQAQKGLKTAVISCNGIKLEVEIAKTDNEQAIGLMHRKELLPGKGMIFVYEYDSMLSFWMKNTLIPLSIAYISSNGVVKQIFDMVPLSLAPVQSDFNVRYALEVPLAWFTDVGIKVGDVFDVSEL